MLYCTSLITKPNWEYQSIDLVIFYSNAKMQPKYYNKSLFSLSLNNNYNNSDIYDTRLYQY